mmetsp:Transcript_24568/g.79349  ORF Transcript_24568/g.79349 Transcript_24568/m.79349 type:complete len:117 (-) Transcript_24568:551-901(-)
MPAPGRSAGRSGPPKPKAKPRKGPMTHTNKALTARKVNLVAARDDVRDAVAWCVSTGQGAKAAIKTGEFPFATVGKVRQALLHGSSAQDRDHHLQLLTNLERIRVADWALRSAVGG